MYCLCTRCIIINSVQVRSEFGKFAYTAICMRKCTLWSDNTCVFTRFHSVKNANTQPIWSSAYPWYIDPPTHGISTPQPMEYQPPYPWYINPPTYGILTHLPMVFWPPTHGISTPQPKYNDPPTHGISTPLPKYIDPPTHGILTTLPTHGISTPPTHGILTPLLYPWNIDPPIHGILTPYPFKIHWNAHEHIKCIILSILIGIFYLTPG